MTTKLQQSFGTVHKLLQSPRGARRIVASILVIHTLLLCYSAYVHSPTLNEPAHLVAGLSYWKFGRFDVYNVNPPLVRIVAAVPVIAVGYEEDWTAFDNRPGARPEAALGAQFVAANGERSFFLVMIARWVCIPFSWIGAIYCFLWARDLYGRPAGVLAATIWCFEPNILAHSSVITADIAAAAIGVAACYNFWRWLIQPTIGQAFLTGIVLGLAELTKCTLVIFLPLWPLMWFVYRLPARRRTAVGSWCKQFATLALILTIGLYVLNAGYAFEGSLTRLKQFQFVSELFAGANRDTQSTNRFTGSWLGELPVPLPRNYVLGIDVQQRDFEYPGRASYLCGKWQGHGWWYYYLYACFLKVPLALSVLGLCTVLGRFAACSSSTNDYMNCKRTHKIQEKATADWPLSFSKSESLLPKNSLQDELMVLLPAIAIFAIVSSKSGISEHVRYILPAFPYFFIAISQVSCCLTVPLKRVKSTSEGEGRKRFVMPFFSFIIVNCCWLIASSLYVYPHSLSYFNETVGGPTRGHDYLLGSNVDWGQDLRYLRSWELQAHNEQPLRFAYFGFIRPTDLGLKVAALACETDIPLSTSVLSSCNVAISMNLLFGDSRPIYNDAGELILCDARCFENFRDLIPQERIGYSIRLFQRMPNRANFGEQ